MTDLEEEEEEEEEDGTDSKRFEYNGLTTERRFVLFLFFPRRLANLQQSEKRRKKSES